ncbi:2OG-Fe(II) oxygenase [Ferrimonas pelagia]|uniref:2OG-Fe(II) oxygenase n=2 Tax=Ferrimonas pelagia TaxID=1177826 RepID=A0ABP9FHY9_9GAMM
MEADGFRNAAIGRGVQSQVNTGVRRDEIAWIEAQSHTARLWLEWAERLRLHLNRHLYLGLFSFESHFARYQPGQFYQTHLDAFRGRSNRVVTLLTYLNHDWLKQHGGELLIYPDNRSESPVALGVSVASVLPALGTLVVFLSDRFPHEVLPATRPRLSVAGWFRLNE